jgi:hypothetical protein
MQSCEAATSGILVPRTAMSEFRQTNLSHAGIMDAVPRLIQDTAMPTFRLSGLPAAPFAELTRLSDDALAARGIRRVIADHAPGYPCRVSLEDAAVGETVFLLPFAHHDVDSPYRASGPIYVRANAEARTLAPGEVPPYVRTRLMSLRAYDRAHMMTAATVVDGELVAATLERLFANPDIAYVHLHNAKPGCYSCLAERVDDSATARPGFSP